MTKIEHLLTILAEECCEVGQRASKALRFGLDEVQDGQELTNLERLTVEMKDLLCVFIRLGEEVSMDATSVFSEDEASQWFAEKDAKLEKYFELSRKLGTLTD